jgi:hypothetical protein
MPTIPLSGETPRGAINTMEIGVNAINARKSDYYSGELLSKMAGGLVREHKCRFIRREHRRNIKPL